MMNQKTTQHIKQEIANNNTQIRSGTLGVISSYDDMHNTATVIITKPQSDEVDEILTNVMCPRTLGIQTVAPMPGIQCWVVFKDNNVTQPLITHFFNHRYFQYDYAKQTKTMTSLPSYLIGLSYGI